MIIPTLVRIFVIYFVIPFLSRKKFWRAAGFGEKTKNIKGEDDFDRRASLCMM
jgi:hypothetical protein